MKVTFHVTYDFIKAKKKLKGLVPKVKEDLGLDIAERWRKNLKEGTYDPIEDSTKEIRLKRGNMGTTPLFETGNLYNSIRATKTTIKHLKYGDYHLREHTTSSTSMIPNQAVPARNWKGLTDTILSEKQKEKFFKEIFKGIRASGKGKMIR